MNAFYLDVDSATHQANFDTYSNQGLRLVALTMRDNGGNTLYSAAWVQNDGRAWVACHGFTEPQLLQFYSNWQPQGFEMKVLTSTETLFGAVMEATKTGTQFVYDLTDATLPNQNQLSTYQKEGSNLAPRAIAIYGAAGATRRYAVIFEPCQENWAIRQGDTDTVATQAISAYFNDLRYRPTLLTYTPEGLIIGVFRDNSIGTDSWTTGNGLSAAAVTAIYAASAGRGLWPLSLSVNPVNDTFACVMVTTETPLARQFSISGSDVANLAGTIDPVVQGLMQSGAWSSVGQPRAISVAVAYQQRLMFAKAYTWAEPTYPVANPTSMFRMASCSKPITSIAILRLIQDGLLADTDTVAKINLSPPPGGAFPAGFTGLTVNELMSMRSGLHPWSGGDATVAAAYGHPTPVSIYEAIAYSIANGTLTPYASDGTNGGFPSSTTFVTDYQNVNYALLGLMIRAVTNGLYTAYVQSKIFSPLGLTRPCVGASLHAQRATLEVQHHSSNPSGVGANLVTADPPLVGSGYGTMDYENFEGFADWSISTVDYAAILAAVGVANPGNYPVLNAASIATLFQHLAPTLAQSTSTLGGLYWGMTPGGATIYNHNGSWNAGGLNISSWVTIRSDGVSAAVFMNMDDAGGVLHNFACGNQKGQLQSSLDGFVWPATGDLFPSFGIPALTIPVITTTTMPPGIAGTAYSATIMVSGGNPPYNFSISSGSLPNGLTIDATSGVISGTPSGSSGIASFTVQVTDSSSPARTATANLSIKVR